MKIDLRETFINWLDIQDKAFSRNKQQLKSTNFFYHGNLTGF